MRNPPFNQHLIAKTGEHLSRKPKELRVRAIKKEESLASPTSYPRRPTTPVTRNLLLGLVWALMTQEVLAQEEKEEIFDKKKSDDIFKADYSPLSQPNSTRPLYKTNPKKIYQKLIKTHSDNFLAQPDKKIVFESFPEEILSGFLNQKNFNHKDKGPLTFVTYLAYQENKQSNFLGILKHSTLNSGGKIDLLNLLTSQVDDNGNNILHISCIINNFNHLDAIFQNFNSAFFSISSQKSAIDKQKKDMIMKFNNDQFTPLMQVVKDNRLEMVNKILSESKSFDKVDYSFDVLMQVNKSGNSPLLLAIKGKNYKLIESLLVNFDSYTSEQKTQIQNVFKDSDKQISDDILSSAVNNNSDNISQIIKTLKKINYSKVELKDLLTAKNSNGDTAFIFLACNKRIGSILEIINEFDGGNPEERGLLKEILLQQNKNGNALDFLVDKNPDEEIIQVLKALKSKFSKDDLKDLLTAKNSNGDSAILLLVNNKRIESIIEIINEFDGKNPEEGGLLKEILLQRNINGYSALELLIANNPDEKIIEVINAFKSKLSKTELKDLLTDKNSGGDTAFIFLADSKKIGSIIEIINEFDGGNREESGLLKEILLQQNKNGNALDFLVDKNPDEKIIQVLNALKSKFSKDDLKDLLTARNGHKEGNFAIVFLAKNGMIESILSVISAFDIDEEADRNHLKEIFLKRNQLGGSALYYLVNNTSNESTPDLSKLV